MLVGFNAVACIARDITPPHRTLCCAVLSQSPLTIRVFEALVMGAIPVIIKQDDSELWLPYDVTRNAAHPAAAGVHGGTVPGIDWSRIAVIVSASQLASLPLLLLGMSPVEVASRRQLIASLRDTHFTGDGMHSQVERCGDCCCCRRRCCCCCCCCCCGGGIVIAAAVVVGGGTVW
jgi:hypothetical protein